ncbi:hypothetical protein LOAG_04161 [Loa loa]|uniref:Uncharacterized protein n=1 Tax=Loa loa TaxID=7209 RepID=A0A1S0U386_LOALO|nr:hypothetical protein LOAG_04161 [Loa loa]EFO24328.1 hypothetical protein LOAG_04161 [Loa loa]
MVCAIPNDEPNDFHNEEFLSKQQHHRYPPPATTENQSQTVDLRIACDKTIVHVQFHASICYTITKTAGHAAINGGNEETDKRSLHNFPGSRLKMNLLFSRASTA